jgi:hypothetical protein
MMATGIKEQELSNDELKEIASGLNSFGDMLIMMGKLAKIEKELTGLDKLMNRLFQADNRELFLAMGSKPELMDKAVGLVKKWEILAEKDPLELLPDEQIEVGTSFKEFSSLLTEIIGGTAQAETQSK